VKRDGRNRNGLARRMIFPAAVLILYAILFVFMPEGAFTALKSSGKIALHIVWPLSLAFVMMVILNVWVRPVHIARFLGSRAGLKGVAFSTVAGIISMGPIYVWYPLLKELREKGARIFHLTNFLNNRTVKPFLLPIMIFYFGWMYALILTCLTIWSSLLVGYSVEALTTEKTGHLESQKQHRSSRNIPDIP